jgi:hypothetical protein
VPNPWRIEVDDDTDILMPFEKALFIDAEMWHDGRLPALLLPVTPWRVARRAA